MKATQSADFELILSDPDAREQLRKLIRQRADTTLALKLSPGGKIVVKRRSGDTAAFFPQLRSTAPGK